MIIRKRISIISYLFIVILFAIICVLSGEEQSGTHYRKAFDLYNNHIYLGAVNEAQIHLTENPKHIDSYILISKIYIELKKYSESLDTLLIALNIDPNNEKLIEEMNKLIAFVENDEKKSSKIEYVSIYLKIARSYSKIKDYAQAIHYYKKYLQKNPKDLDAVLEIARVFSWAKEYSNCIQPYELYIKHNPNEKKVILEIADIYIWTGDLPMAEEKLLAAIELDNKNSTAHLKLGNVYEWQGDYIAAEDEYMEVIDLYENDIVMQGGDREDLFRFSDNETDEDYSDEVQSLFENDTFFNQKETINKTNTTSPVVNTVLQNDYNEAKKGIYRLQGLESKTKKWQTSIGLKSIIRETKDYALYLNIANLLYEKEGKKEEGIKYYRQYLDLYPEDYKTMLKLARIFSWNKNYNESSELYGNYLNKYPEDYKIRLELAKVYMWGNILPSALAELEIIRRQNPSITEVYFLSGNIYKWQGKYKQALENYRRIVTAQSEYDDTDDAYYRETLDSIRDIQKAFRPNLYLRYTNIHDSSFNFYRFGIDTGARFYINDGGLNISPGLRQYQFKQQANSVQAKEIYTDLKGFFNENWDWFSTLSYSNFYGTKHRVNLIIGTELQISTDTYFKADYTSHDAVYEINNLNALLDSKNISIDSFNLQLNYKFSDKDTADGYFSEGIFSDGNSRERVDIKFWHRIKDSPIVQLGAGYKFITFASSSTYYWTPMPFSGFSILMSLTDNYKNFIFYGITGSITQVIEASQIENSFEGYFTYQPAANLSARMSFGIGRGSAASSVPGSRSTNFLLEIMCKL